MLEVEIDQLPEHKHGINTIRVDKPQSRWSVWARRNGYRIEKQVYPLLKDLPNDEYYIACYGYDDGSKYGHAVVCKNNEIVHNPYPYTDTISNGFKATPYITVHFIKE